MQAGRKERIPLKRNPESRPKVSRLQEIRHRVFPAMTRGADMRWVLVKSFALATACTIFTLPYFHYLTFVVLDKVGSSKGLPPNSFLFTQLFLLFVVCLLSAVVGFSFSERFGLPGFGDHKRFFRSVPALLVIGGAVITLSCFLFDRYFFEVSPVSYPKDFLYLMSIPLKDAFTEEVILRLCMVTLGVGLLKSKRGGVIFVSAVAPLLTIKYFHFMGIEVGLNYLFITQLLLSFVGNLVLGYLFVTHGLLYSMALKFLFGMKYFLLSWTIG